MKLGSGRVLSFGQAVDAIVEKEDLNADVSAQQVNGMVSSDGQRVAIACGYPNFQFGVGDLDAGGDGGRAAMDRVESVGVHVIRETAGAADARDYDEILLADAKLRENRLHRGETDQEVRWCPGCGDYAILSDCTAERMA